LPKTLELTANECKTFGIDFNKIVLGFVLNISQPIYIKKETDNEFTEGYGVFLSRCGYVSFTVCSNITQTVSIAYALTPHFYSFYTPNTLIITNKKTYNIELTKIIKENVPNAYDNKDYQALILHLVGGKFESKVVTQESNYDFECCINGNFKIINDLFPLSGIHTSNYTISANYGSDVKSITVNTVYSNRNNAWMREWHHAVYLNGNMTIINDSFPITDVNKTDPNQNNTEKILIICAVIVGVLVILFIICFNVKKSKETSTTDLSDHTMPYTSAASTTTHTPPMITSIPTMAGEEDAPIDTTSMHMSIETPIIDDDDDDDDDDDEMVH
jgi:hypothetical protein